MKDRLHFLAFDKVPIDRLQRSPLAHFHLLLLDLLDFGFVLSQRKPRDTFDIFLDPGPSSHIVFQVTESLVEE